MTEKDWLAKQFEDHRGHLRGVAYRMLGSLSEADDAIQETWLRLNRSGATGIENLRAWLTTVVARVCLDILRSRSSRREESLSAPLPDSIAGTAANLDPEQEALLADSVGLALLVVLDRLNPPERLSFVLHDMFDVSFEEIASIVGRTPAAARQLASRARRRMQGTPAILKSKRTEQRNLVDALLSALRRGDYDGLIAVLDPDVVVRIDETAARPAAAREIHGALNWAKGAMAFSHLSRFTEPALINGAPALILAPGGRLTRALMFTIKNGRVHRVEIIGDPGRLRELDLRLMKD